MYFQSVTGVTFFLQWDYFSTIYMCTLCNLFFAHFLHLHFNLKCCLLKELLCFITAFFVYFPYVRLSTCFFVYLFPFLLTTSLLGTDCPCSWTIDGYLRNTYLVTQNLPQINTAKHETFPIQIRKITVQICGDF